MEQLRHRLTNVSRNGQTCRADQNPLKRTDLDDFVDSYFGGKRGSQSRGYSGNRHERKESERFKSFTYDELSKRDP
jgi:type I restriction enzyme M protein